MNAVTPILLQESKIEWDAYLLTDDDKARLIRPSDLFERTKAVVSGMMDYEGVSLPWEKASSYVRLRRGKVSIWAGITHHGKTKLLKQICLHLAKSGEKVCIASLEEAPEETFADMATQMLGRDAANDEWLDVAVGWATNKIWLYDQQGMLAANRLLALIGYCAKEKGCTHFVVDSLMRLGLPADDYEAQRVFLNRVTNYARQLNVHVHVVCHMRKQSSEEDIPNLFDIRGAAAIAEQADNVFVVWRDKRSDKDQDEPDGVLVVEKQRGRPNWLGRINLWNHPETGQFLGHRLHQPMRFIQTLSPNTSGLAQPRNTTCA